MLECPSNSVGNVAISPFASLPKRIEMTIEHGVIRFAIGRFETGEGTRRLTESFPNVVFGNRDGILEFVTSVL